jgi:hypothetical protein
MSSLIIKQAIDNWRALRQEYEYLLEAAYESALDATSGKMLNLRGQDAGIDPYSLLMGTEVRAMAYASPELVEHWVTHPRVTFQQYEIQMSALSEFPENY